ncbi:type II secretion system protein [Sulfuriflexus sp.]|uniref:type II secretion system protein n=1 Tax=Sulfuriflexus sp. TaxID=2015443 RepID=UPI0028CF9061|nr:type II secretion system protein [Sulfuriflexus sp.]MDT8404409.1 type II secretion system protein [Sulfuriflexus sp.]
MRYFRQQGFTLVEMIIVIVISGILLSVVSVFIAQPIQGFIDLSRRATLVYSAENALRRMQRDIRRALPNSVRVSGNALELISTVEGARYRASPPPGDPDRRLQFTLADSDFDVLGNLSSVGVANLLVAIYNIGAVDSAGLPLDGSNAYAAGTSNVITPPGTTVNITQNGDEDHIEIVDGWQFSHESPSRRLYLVDTAVSYVCNGGQLVRYTGYDFTNAVQPNPPAGGIARLMADNVAACSFSYAPGTNQRSGVTTLDLTISDTATGEQIRLLHQVHVDNAP